MQLTLRRCKEELDGTKPARVLQRQHLPRSAALLTQLSDETQSEPETEEWEKQNKNNNKKSSDCMDAA